jgi:putative oxidoreductase
MRTYAMPVVPRSQGVRARMAAVTAFLGRLPLPIALLLFRLAIAGVCFKAGRTKTASWEFTVQLFADEYKVLVLPPEIAAMLAVTFELGCASLLALGLATR